MSMELKETISAAKKTKEKLDMTTKKLKETQEILKSVRGKLKETFEMATANPSSKKRAKH
jgi:Ni,Fe-hydrogenase III large subunit